MPWRFLSRLKSDGALTRCWRDHGQRRVTGTFAIGKSARSGHSRVFPKADIGAAQIIERYFDYGVSPLARLKSGGPRMQKRGR